jgi:hypothetical protein
MKIICKVFTRYRIRIEIQTGQRKIDLESFSVWLGNDCAKRTSSDEIMR